MSKDGNGHRGVRKNLTKPSRAAAAAATLEALETHPPLASSHTHDRRSDGYAAADRSVHHKAPPPIPPQSINREASPADLSDMAKSVDSTRSRAGKSHRVSAVDSPGNRRQQAGTRTQSYGAAASNPEVVQLDADDSDGPEPTEAGTHTPNASELDRMEQHLDDIPLAQRDPLDSLDAPAPPGDFVFSAPGTPQSFRPPPLPGRTASTAGTQELLEQFRLDMAEDFKEQVESVYKRIVSKVERLFSRFDQQIKSKFNVVDTELHDLRSCYRRLEEMHTSVLKDVQVLKERLAVAESGDSAEVFRRPQLEKFDRGTLPNILVISCQFLVHADAIIEGVRAWLEEWGSDSPSTFQKYELDVHYRIRHRPGSLGKRFILEFIGPGDVGAKRCTAAYSRLRNSGQWRDLFCQDPSGNSHKLFVNIDKSPKTVATERLGKHMFKVLEDEMGRLKVTKELHLLRWQGICTVDWVSLAKVVPAADRSFAIYWNMEQVESLGVDRNRVAARMAEVARNFGVTDNVQWSL